MTFAGATKPPVLKKIGRSRPIGIVLQEEKTEEEKKIGITFKIGKN